MSRTPLIIIATASHSGSRLLTRVLDNAGIYMGRYRFRIGDDEREWSLASWHAEFRRSRLRYALGGEQTPLMEFVERRFDDWEKGMLTPSLTNRMRRYVKSRVSRTGEYQVRRPTPQTGIGFKTAIGSVMLLEPLRELLFGRQRLEDTYFIHLTRNVGSWLESGHANGTKGIPRPLLLPFANNFSDDYIRYCWFNSVDRFVELAGGEQLDLLTVTTKNLMAHREYLESMFWENLVRRAAEFSEQVPNFYHVRFEDLVTDPEETCEKLGEFLDLKVHPVAGMEPKRASSVPMPNDLHPAVGDTMRAMGYEPCETAKTINLAAKE